MISRSIGEATSFANSLDDKYDGNLNDWLSDSFGDSAVNDSNQYYLKSGDIVNAAAKAGGSSLGPGVQVATNDEGLAFSLVAKNSSTTIDGNSYYAVDILDTLKDATDNATAFVSKQAGMYWDNLTSQYNVNTSLVSFFQNYGQALATGQISVGDALKYFAVNFAEKALADTVTENLMSPAMIELRDAIRTNNGDVKAILDRISNEEAQDSLTHVLNYIGVSDSASFANGIYEALGQMAVEFALHSGGWSAADFVRAGSSIITGVAINHIVTSELGFTGAIGSSTAGAITSVVISLINGGPTPSLSSLGLSAATAFASMYAATAVVSYATGYSAVAASTYGPMMPLSDFVAAQIAAAVGSQALGAALGAVLVPVVGILIGFAIGKIITGLFGSGKTYGPGEFASIDQLYNSIYQVQTITVDGQQVPALVAVSPQGSTVLVSGTNIGYVIGNVGADVLVGTDAIQTITGNAGADYLEARGGDDNLMGGDGNDHLNGGDGADVLQGDAGGDIIFGEAGVDTVLAGAGDDFVHLGSGDDIASGGDGNDYILASGGNDATAGDAGDDTLDGGYGDDTMDGGAGNDLMLGNLGNDSLSGADGGDTIFGDDGNDSIEGGNGNDFIDGGDGVDILHGDAGRDMIVGGAGDDFLDGGLADDILLGGDGNDVILGGLDNDYLRGDAGDDSLAGGMGDDVLAGGAGVNTLQGAEGNDVYVIGADAAEHDGLIQEDDGGTADSDTILLNWMTAANAQSGLTLTQNANDLVVAYGGRVLATVQDQFVAGHGVERIELAAGSFINLSAVTYNATSHLGAFSVLADAGGSVASQLQLREQEATANLLNKENYWNDTFLNKLSQIAYDEELRDQTTYTYYNGTEFESFKRSQGKFGGKYEVYKLATPGNIDGTDSTGLKYAIQDAEDQASAAAFGNDIAGLPGTYESLINGAKIVYSNFGGKSIQDIEINGVVVSTKVAGDSTLYAAGSTLFGASYAQRLAAGSTAISDVATKKTGDDLLVGAYWDETLNGKSGDDVLVSNEGNDRLLGGDGNDWLFGGEGSDTHDGGNGDDVMLGGAGNDSFLGGAGDDAVLGGDGNDTLSGDAGNDWLDAGAGNDSVLAADGADLLIGGAGDDTLDGGNGNDVIHGNDGNDILTGGAGDDTLYGGFGNDSIYGGDGTDVIDGGGSAVLMDGGAGNDQIVFTNVVSGITLDLSTGATGGGAAAVTVRNFESVVGTDYNDSITGASANEALSGAGGNDTLSGGAGNDTLLGGVGNDSLSGGDGNDTIEGGYGIDTIIGGAGSNTASYASSGNAVTINLNLTTAQSGGDAQGDILSGIQSAIGSAYSDVIIGTSGNNSLDGGVGGNYDTLVGGAGNDAYWVDALYDVITENANEGNDTVYSADSNYVLGANLENMVLIGTIASNATGNTLNNLLTGNSANNRLSGSDGNDTLIGGAGADTLDGGAGFDTVSYETAASNVYVYLTYPTQVGPTASADSYGDVFMNIEAVIGTAFGDSFFGSSGNDVFYGGAGGDSFTGDAGADTFDGGADHDYLSYFYSNSAITINLATGVALGGFAQGDVLSNIEGIGGSQYSDFITGSAADNQFEAAGGADTLDGGAGIDIAQYTASASAVSVNLNLTTAQSGGDAQGDILTNIENVMGSTYNDFITGNSGNNLLQGYDGNDSLTGGAGADTLDGGAGTDDIANYVLATSAVSINMSTNINTGGEAQGDILLNIERVYGSAYNDLLIGNDSENFLNGAGGNDTLIGGFGADTLMGDTGNDLLSYADSAVGVTVNLKTNINTGGTAEGDKIYYIYNVLGSSYSDNLYGTGDANLLTGGSGNDTIYGDADNDTIYGDDGNDFLHSGSGNNTLYGGAGNDTLTGGIGVDSIDGGTGRDFVRYEESTAGVNVNLTSGINTGGIAQGDKLYSIEQIGGTNYNDTIIGDAESNDLFGEAGDDSLSGLDNNDYMWGGTGADTLDGGNGIDLATYYGGLAAVNVNLQTNLNTGGESQGDKLYNIENIEGTSYNDFITGNTASNYFTGADGNDTLIGAAGADTLDGGNGTDTASYASSSAAVSVNLGLTTAQSGGDAAGDILLNIENVAGSAYADYIIGNSGNNQLSGLDGNDILTGGAGADTLDGGNGIDTASYAGSAVGIYIDLNLTSAQPASSWAGADSQGDVLIGIENIIGSSFDDNVKDNGANSLLQLGSGNDDVVAGAGADTLDGGDGSDGINYVFSNTGVVVNLATNVNTGGYAQGDVLYSVERIIGSQYADFLTGDANNNTFIGHGGADTIDGGAGTDGVEYTSSQYAININLSLTTAQAGGDASGDVLKNIENVLATANNDILVGSNANNILIGDVGNDTIDGGDGNDTLIGGAGDNKYWVNILGDVGTDVLNGGGGNDQLIGASGNDTLIGGVGADTLDGGNGIDTASYVTSSAAVTVNLGLATAQTGGDAAGDILVNIENVTGSAYADSITGNSGNNLLSGADGNDTLLGGAGADTLDGGTGDDLFDGGSGADRFYGGGGTDTISYKNSSAAVNINIAQSTYYGGDAEGDYLAGSGIGNAIGSDFNDTIVGAGITTMLRGGAGNDLITSLSTGNSIYGDQGNDTINGSSGNETMDGGAGADRFFGGGGSDTISYKNSSSAVNIDLAKSTFYGGDAEGDYLAGSGIGNAIGSDFNDTIVGASITTMLRGGAGNDIITSLSNGNIIYGDQGNDTIYGSAGNETMYGGIDNDLIYLGAGDKAVENANEGIDKVISSVNYSLEVNFENLTLASGSQAINGLGNELDNIVEGNELNNSLYGLDGNDTLIGGIGADTLDGGNNTDTASYANSQGSVSVNLYSMGLQSGGDAQGDILSNIENIVGSRYDDMIVGSAVNNLLQGADGSDTLIGDLGADTLDGGNGNDQLYGGGDNDSILGGAGNDTVYGWDGNDSIMGGDANDLIMGDAGSDTIYGDAGDDVLFGYSENDSLIGGSGNDLLSGETENDTLIGGAGADTLNGGAGADTASYAGSTAAVTVNLNLTTAQTGGDAAGDILTSIENILGSSYNDVLTGNTVNNKLQGGDGNDTLIGGAGADTLDGGAGNDTASYAGSAAAVTVNLNLTTAQVGGDAAGDILTAMQHLVGSSYNDVLTGNTGNNKLQGGDGNDTLIGGAGADTLDGGAGNDTASYAGSAAAVTVNLNLTTAQTGGDATGDILTAMQHLVGSSYNDVLTGNTGNNKLQGGDGNDTLLGGGGVDTFTGGLGSELFIYKAITDSGIGAGARDIITDFKHSEGDRIDLSAFTGTFKFLGTGAFTGGANPELRFMDDGTNTIVQVDANHDKATDFEIQINGHVTLASSDFVL